MSIEFRQPKQNELDEIKALCASKNIDYPSRVEVIFIAIDNGKIVGVCALQKVFIVEPLINISGYAQVAEILAEKVTACASLVTSEVQALVRDPKNVELFERYGLSITDKDITIMRKEV